MVLSLEVNILHLCLSSTFVLTHIIIIEEKGSVRNGLYKVLSIDKRKEDWNFDSKFHDSIISFMCLVFHSGKTLMGY